MKRIALLIIGIFFVSIVFSGCIDQEIPSEKGVCQNNIHLFELNFA
jgi:hypothetical protein